MNHPYAISIHRAVERGRAQAPIMIRARLRETEPRHADMLRYDGAFCNPLDVSQVVFPIWKTPNGRLGGGITVGRWESFAIQLILFRTESENTEVPSNLNDWYTYVHGPKYELIRVTWAEYTKIHPKYKLVGWR